MQKIYISRNDRVVHNEDVLETILETTRKIQGYYADAVRINFLLLGFVADRAEMIKLLHTRQKSPLGLRFPL